jgi:hypothetical protein
LHPSAEQNPFGSQIDTDVCVRSPEKWLDYVTEEAYHFVVLFVHQNVHILGYV